MYGQKKKASGLFVKHEGVTIPLLKNAGTALLTAVYMKSQQQVSFLALILILILPSTSLIRPISYALGVVLDWLALLWRLSRT